MQIKIGCILIGLGDKLKTYYQTLSCLFYPRLGFAREDIKSAVSFLESRDEVDHEYIGVLGICASGGYVPFAAQTDLRIKAVATVSGADMGDLFRKGLTTSIAPNLDHLLEESNKARTEEAQGKPPRLEHIVPNTPEEIPKDTPPGGLYREGTD